MKYETKRERFTRLAEARTNRILEHMRLLGNCSNTSNYEYTDEEVRKIFTTLETELKKQKARFRSSGTAGERFTLD